MNENLNPLANLYDSFLSIINNLVIKYSVKAEEYETMETKQYADSYIDSFLKRDTFLSYRDYTIDEYHEAGLFNDEIIKESYTNIRCVPERYRNTLLENRRKTIISSYTEKNDYYRMLNGYPSIGEDETNFFYVTKEISETYDISKNVPVHEIQDYYNLVEKGSGDKLINILDGIGYISSLVEAHPEKEYLKFIGSNRISIITSRQSKNFEIIRLNNDKINHILYDEFIVIYEQCRDYFMSTIYNPQFRSIMEYYDNFIGMCIMVMTINQIVMKQLPLYIERNFYDSYSIQTLYEVYGIPYNLLIDEETQKSIVHNLNILVNNKSTNTVLYDVTNLLGFSNMKIYKYFLVKEHKYDQYGVPIIKYEKKFNNDTGEIEVVPDYKAMYNVFFQRAEIIDEDIQNTFNNKINKVDYHEIVDNDPFWIEDEKLYKQLWETNYNYVESKYLGFGVSYRMTDILYENILLLKMLMNNSEIIDGINITLPKISESMDVPLFDSIILLLCLISKKHSIRGEIISIPTQVISVLDYLQNTNDTTHLVDTFSFNFDYFSSDKGKKAVEDLKKMLPKEKSDAIDKYLSILSISSNASNTEKIDALNNMYTNIKGFADFLSYEMTDCDDIDIYNSLKTMYRAAFYSKEVRNIFSITGKSTGITRTAKNFFEFLYHRNTKLYSSVFTFNMNNQYLEYLKDNNLNGKEFTFSMFQSGVEDGSIDVDYDIMLGDNDESSEDTLYYYINHIISRLSDIIHNLNFIAVLNDSATPLEELLIKLLRFFKSMTTDIISTDIVYICDSNMENMMRMIDKLNYMKKTIDSNEKIELSYSDVISSICNTFGVNDKFFLNDKMVYETILYLVQKEYNHIFLKDNSEINKEIISDIDTIIFTDTSSSSEILRTPDKIKLRDAFNIFYS